MTVVLDRRLNCIGDLVYGNRTRNRRSCAESLAGSDGYGANECQAVDHACKLRLHQYGCNPSDRAADVRIVDHGVDRIVDAVDSDRGGRCRTDRSAPAGCDSCGDATRIRRDVGAVSGDNIHGSNGYNRAGSDACIGEVLN